MIENVRRLSVEDNDVRFTVLCSILDERSIGYEIQSSNINGRETRNIIISSGRGDQTLVVGAHHDSVPGSTGANDNASGVAVLVETADFLIKNPPPYKIDIVFFDHEESGALGSRLYMEKAAGTVRAMVNLDICGVGDSIIIGPARNTGSDVFKGCFDKLEKRGRHDYHILEMLPPGDDRIFDEAGIPNISIGIVEKSDVIPMSVLFDGKTEVEKSEYPSIIETMHNGKRDSIDVIQPESLEKVFEFTYDLLGCL